MGTDPRRAALTLHALAAPDRDWVLRRLDAQQQRDVQHHLGELEAMGLAADARLVEQALQQSATVPEPAWRPALRACDAQRLHGVLRDEPAALIARVLNNGPWPWEKAFLARLDKVQRFRVDHCRMQEVPVSRELDEALLCALAARLALPDSVPVEAAGWKARVSTLLDKMRRAR